MLKRGAIAGILALVTAALLATILIVVFLPIIGYTNCPIWANPIRVTTSLVPDAMAHIGCIDDSGHLHDYGNAVLLQWAIGFGPVFLVTFILLFISRWVRRLSQTG